MTAIIKFVKKETVLSAAWLLAFISVFFVHPSAAYAGYIDFRSLGILWSMMVIMAGLKKHGFFSFVGRKLLDRAKGTRALVLVLVFLCFFFSMLITNDVSLLTFVPFTITVLAAAGRRKLIVPVVVLQTLAANLGSMLTPIGNPQNLYLYGISGMSIGDFLALLAPYTAVTALLLVVSCLWVAGGEKVSGTGEAAALADANAGPMEKSIPAFPITACGETSLSDDTANKSEGALADSGKQIAVYGILFALAIPVVLRFLPWPFLALLVLLAVFVMEKEVLISVDYALLATFVGFFIFTGNMGSMPAAASLLQQLVQGHETIWGILASQVISNVPAALLLSGFTENYAGLILGVDLGGLGTLIASMASLISYKFVVRDDRTQKGRYFLQFTVANVVYLLILLLVYVVI